VIAEPVLRFIRSSIKSVWTLELLLVMRRAAGRAWTIDEITNEMRSNRTLVSDIVTALIKDGLIEEQASGVFRYRPANAELDELVQQLDRLYAERPLALIKEIVSAPNERIQTFADAFKLKKD
jgi:hypothetical protein